MSSESKRIGAFLSAFQPRINSCIHHEPTLEVMLTAYYRQAFEPDDARMLASMYVATLVDGLERV